MEQRYKLENGAVIATSDAASPISLFINPTEAEKRYLVQELKLDEHTLNSALDPDELARLEFEPEHSAIIYKNPMPHSGSDPFLFKVASVGVYLFADRLIIVTADPTYSIPNQIQRVQSLKQLLLRLIYRSIFSFLEHLKIISQISDELQSDISAAMDNRYLLNLFSLQKSLVYYLNFINSNDLVINRLRNYAGRLEFSEAEQELLDDIRIENTQCFKQADIYSNILASLMDARASIVGNNLNVLMKTLTFITLSIMVPTFIVSAFSMNVSMPIQTHPWSWWLIMGLAVVSSLLVIGIWKYKKL